MKEEFYYPSADGVTQIHAIEWAPEIETGIKCILQICHGMVEYIDRYDEFARYMAKRGCCVIGHDHLGHGKSVRNKDELGYFQEEKGNHYIIEDIHRLRLRAKEKYGEVPYYMLGHSMGSFLLRQYIAGHGEGLAGAVIMETGYKGSLLLNSGQLICRGIAAVKGWKYRSTLVDKLSFGGFNKRFEPGETSKEWLSTDEEICRAYKNDPLCSFVFTVAAYFQMFEGMKTLNKKRSLQQIPKNLPLLIVSGKDDPVGSFGKGVRKVYRKYQAAGMEDVTLRLYEGDRHEILNEKDRQKIYEDLYCWIVKP